MSKITFVIPVITIESTKAILSNINDFEDCDFILINNSKLNISDNIAKLVSELNIVNYQFIDKEETDIAESINIGIYQATGDYIMPLLNKLINVNLNDLYNTIKNQAEGIWFYTETLEIPKTITLSNYKKQTILDTFILSRACVSKLPFLLEGYYNDYFLKFLLTLLHHNFTVNLLSIYKGEFSRINLENKRVDKCYNYNLGNDLTCIIPFKNEGCEVEKTVQSIRATTKGVQIVLVNDDSSDGYNYKWIAEKFCCDYIENIGSPGSGPTKQKGVDNCKTKYFVLLDAHMRFYKNEWDVELVNVLENNPNTILCLDTIVISKDTKLNYYKNENGKNTIVTHAAYLKMHDSHTCIEPKWAGKFSTDPDMWGIGEVPIILGANYCASKEYWNYVDGYNGLLGYGLEEPFISTKCWLMGGRCGLYRNIKVGHLYRDLFPYRVDDWKCCFNRMLIINTIFDSEDDKQKFMGYLHKNCSKDTYDTAIEYYNNHLNEIKERISSIRSKFTKPFTYFCEVNDRAQ